MSLSFTTRKSSTAATKPAGRVFLTIFFLFFAGIGGVLSVLTIKSAMKSLSTYSWQRVGCEILESEVGSGKAPGDFVPEVRYSYEMAGSRFESTRYWLNRRTISDYTKALRSVQKFPVGSKSTCLVNPAQPSESILERESLAGMLFSIPFTLIFFIIGVGGLYFTWRRRPRGTVVDPPLSEQVSPARAAGCLLLFFGVFFLFGVAGFFGFIGLPLFKILKARTWTPVPCAIISSGVREHSGEDGSTYSVQVFYSYEFNGREYRSSRYKFMPGSSSGYEGKAAVVSKLGPGTRSTCYVNPNHPEEAVINRGFTPDMLFGLIPLVFAVVGLAGLHFGRRNLKQKMAGQGANPLRQAPGAAPDSPLLLKATTPPVAKLFIVIGIALFWNGIVSVFVVEALKSWRRHQPEWGLSLFLIPFVVVGMLLIFGVIYQFLCLFNPRARMELAPGSIGLGGNATLNWQILGRAERIGKLRIHLQGREEATYRQGTSTAVDKSIFFSRDLVTVDQPAQNRSGTATVALPATGVMHSFSSDHNKIIWSIHIRGKIRRWPDLKEEYPIQVLPAENSHERT